MTAPRALELGGDDLEVAILAAAGGRIHRIRAFGEDLLRTPDDPATHARDPFFWGAYVMTPWCNRASPGSMDLAGRRIRLEPNFRDGTAIHGLVSSAPWDRVGPGELAIRFDSDHRWPWAFETRQSATVEGASLKVAYQVTNLERDAPMPAGIGLHPWFRRPVELSVPAEQAYGSNVASSPEPLPVAGDLEMRTLRRVADGLDATLTALTQPRIELAWPDVGIRARIDVETDAAGVLVAVATPPNVDAIAVEPQTHGPDGLRRLVNGEPDALTLLAPGEALRLALRITVERVSLSG
jgi:aldose 1-epimerase